MKYGKSFHVFGPTYEKAPCDLLKLGHGGTLSKKKSLSNLELLRLISLRKINSLRYSGARSLIHLNTKRHNLNLILNLTGKKCNFFK